MSSGGLTGPTATKDIDPKGLGISPAIAAFIAANASPFTNPRDMPAAPKVPDPRFTQTTNTAFLWAHLDIPVVAQGTNGEQLVISCPDPFAPVPLSWCNTMAESDITYGATVAAPTVQVASAWKAGYRTPNTLAREYEVAGLGKLTKQIADLAKRCKTYRVVGHGLKVWVSKNTTVSRGNIEAGQFTYDGSRNGTINSMTTRGIGTQRWSTAPGLTSAYGVHAALMQTSAINTHRASIRPAKEQEMGFLPADEGATVRWTDTSNYAFQVTVPRGLVIPMQRNYNGGAVAFMPVGITAVDGSPGVAANVNDANPTSYEYALDGTSRYEGTSVTSPLYNDLIECGSVSTALTPLVAAAYGVRTTWAQYAGHRDYKYITIGGDANLYNGADMVKYLTDGSLSFDKGLYCDVQGVSSDQVLTVQVCWHIEYVPNNNEPWSGENSPVDMAYEEYAAMVRSRAAFPIVVKGHSFFSSLRKAFGVAMSGAQKIFAVAAPMAQGILASLPHPAAQAASVGIGAVGNILNAYKRKAEDD